MIPAQRLRRPPYARAIAERRRRGAHPLSVLVLAGIEAWDMARLIGAKDAKCCAIVVLPPPGAPESYDWRWVRGIRCRIWRLDNGADDETLRRLAIALVRAGAPVVELLRPDGSGKTQFIPDYSTREVRHA